MKMDCRKTLALSLSLLLFNSNLSWASDPVTVISLRAQYVVPAGAESQESSFETPKYFILEGADGSASMHMALPMELVGHNRMISLELVSRSGLQKSFASQNGEAECDGKWTEMTCDIRFFNLSIEAKNRDAFIDQNVPRPQQSLIRAAALHFETDPIGKVLVLGRK
jgi:hypothetical protein